MTSYAFDYRLGVATARWGAPIDVEMSAGLLRVDRRTGELSAEVTVLSTAAGQDRGLLHGRTRNNLSSSRARTELANTLGRRTPGASLDWPGLVERFANETIEAFRRGEPAMLLRDAQPLPETRTLIGPIAPAADPTLLFGDGESAKSLFALAFAMSLHSGEPLIGWRPSEMRRVAFLDWEWDAAPHADRARQLWRGSGELPDLVYVPMRLPLEQEVDRLQRIIREHGITYIIVDSVALACAGAPEEAQVALGFFQALRQLGVGSLLIAHVNRAGDTEKPFGSAFWHNSARQTWYVKRVSDGGDRLTVGLFPRKSNGGPRSHPVGFDVSFSNGITFARADVRDVPDFAAQVPMKDRMTHALQRGAMGLPELADAIGESVDSVRRIADRYGSWNPKSRRPLFVKVGSSLGLASVGHVSGQVSGELELVGATA